MPLQAATGTSDLGSKAATDAASQVGVPYRFGAEAPKGSADPGFDCSALCQWAWSKAGRSIPRTTFLQYPAMRPVSKGSLQPGDLLFYYWNDGGVGPGHVVMYAGGGKIVQAAHSGTNVAVGSVFWDGYVGARRPYGVSQGSTGVVAGLGSAAKGQVSSSSNSPPVVVGGHPGLFPWGIPGVANSIIPGRQSDGTTWSAYKGPSVGDIHIGPIPVPGTGGIEGFFSDLYRYLEIGAGGVLMLFGGVLIAYGATGSKALGKAGAAALNIASAGTAGAQVSSEPKKPLAGAKKEAPALKASRAADTAESRKVSDIVSERERRRPPKSQVDRDYDAARLQNMKSKPKPKVPA